MKGKQSMYCRGIVESKTSLGVISVKLFVGKKS